MMPGARREEIPMAKTMEARRIARTRTVHARHLLHVAIATGTLAVGALPTAVPAGPDDAANVERTADRSAPASSGDRMLGEIVAYYGRAELDRGGWINPYVPSAAVGNPITTVAIGDGVTLGPAGQAFQEGESGDELLSRAVARYTRAMLDRGGWENPFVADSRCAAGNPLHTVSVGEGVTLLGRESRSVTAVAKQ